MTQYWLGLDCGGSWLKAGLYDREGREAGVQRLPLCALSPQPGWAERDMAELWQFGVMFIINCSIGLITPPIGNVLNVISGVAKLKFDDAVRGVFPYVLVLYSLLVVFVFIPDLIILPLKWIN